jgi:spore maturation protein CgeB
MEMLSVTLLEAFSEKPIDILICMAQAPISPRILTELRKRGVITVLWFVEDYLRFTYWQQMAPFYDFIFTIQKGECIEKIRAAGAGEVHYLPTACDPHFHTPLKLSADERAKWGSPISFVGAGYHNRQQMFASLAYEPFKIWGSEWPLCKPFDRLVQEQSRRIAPEEYIKIFNSTDVNLNLHSSTERDGVDPFGDFLNPRTFELAACSAFQLVDERSLLSEAFDIGKEMITFRNAADLKEKIHYYLKHPEERAAIAEKARARVLKDHTYDQRLEQMLSIIYASKYEQLRAKEDSSPWSTMIARAAPYQELHERCQRAFDRGEEPILDALISDIVTGNGKLTETEQKLLFMFHVRKQIIRMTREESGEKS